MTIKLFEGERGSETLLVKLADFKTVISPAVDMLFWFYIKLPDGSWKAVDVRGLQYLADPELTNRNPREAHPLIVGYELALIKEFEGKSSTEKLKMIACMIRLVPISYFLSQDQVKLYE